MAARLVETPFVETLARRLLPSVGTTPRFIGWARPGF